MVRTQIQLTEEQHALLKRLADEEGLSMAEIIRMAIDYFENARSTRSSAAARKRAKAAVGRFKSGVTDLAAGHDRYIADSIL